ncbi:IclR family transcriptional regulator domain-containing protein [Schnuerera ultunensis]
MSVSLKPYLERLKNLTGETVNLTVMDNNQIVYIAQAKSNRLVKMFTTIYTENTITDKEELIKELEEIRKKAMP